MKQLIILIIIAAIGVGIYQYVKNPGEFKKVVEKSKPGFNATADQLYAYAAGQFDSNSWLEAVKYYKKALSKDSNDDGRLNLMKAAEARYKIAASYDQQDKIEPKIEHRQAAANWFAYFVKEHEDHPDFGNRARRRLTELESIGMKPNWQDAR